METTDKKVLEFMKHSFFARTFWTNLETLTLNILNTKNNVTRAQFIYEILETVGGLIDDKPLASLCKTLSIMEKGINLPASQYLEIERLLVEKVHKNLGPEAVEVVLFWLYKI